MVRYLNCVTGKKISFVRLMSFMVAFLMIFNIIFPTTQAVAKTPASLEQSAQTLPLQDGHIAERSDGSFSVKEGDEECNIKVTETAGNRVVDIKNEKNGVTDKLIFDTKAGTVYSTYTGKTINMERFSYDSQDGSSAQKNPAHKKAELAAVVSSPSENFSREIVKISWKQIKDHIGGLGRRAGLAAFLIGYCGGGAGALAIVDTIKAILHKVDRLIPNEPNHGIAIYYKKGAKCRGIRSGLCFAGKKVVSVRLY